MSHNWTYRGPEGSLLPALEMRRGSGRCDDERCLSLYYSSALACCIWVSKREGKKVVNRAVASEEREVVNREVASDPEAVVIHIRDRSIRLGVLGEAYKAEATAATSVAVLDNELSVSVRVVCLDMGGAHIRLPESDRTPQTWCAGSGRQCAMRGHCCRMSEGCMAAGGVVETYPMNSFDMMAQSHRR